MKLKCVGQLENVEFKNLTNSDAQQVTYISVTLSDYETQETIHLNFPKEDFHLLSNSIGKCIIVNYIHLEWSDKKSKEQISFLAIDQDHAFYIFDENPLLG